MLNKYFLDSSKVLPFVTESLIDVNKLSDILLKSINFDAGVFFTLVPEGSNLDRLYEFEAGVVLPQNPIMRTLRNDGTWSSYSFVPNVRFELSKLLMNSLVKNELVCIFDDFTSTAPIEGYELYEKYGKRFDKEVYYILKPHNYSPQLIEKCFQVSNAVWHSLCVLYESDSRDYSVETLTSEDIDHICLKARLIIIGAYDGEGYVFWEKNGANLLNAQSTK